MSALVVVENGRPMADSRTVAEQFGKAHRSVLRAIDRLVEEAGERRPNFVQSFFEAETGNGAVRQFRRFDMDRDAFSLLVMGFTGKEALRWKLDFLEAFNAMERQLRGPALGDQREQVLLIRDMFGDDEARAVARKFGWPVRRPPPLLPRRTSEQSALERLAAAALVLARKSRAGFTLPDLCAAASVDPAQISPGGWDQFRMFAAAQGLSRGQSNVVGRYVEVWRPQLV